MSSERPDNKRVTAKDAFNLARTGKDAQPKINLPSIARDAGIARFDKRLRSIAQDAGIGRFDQRLRQQSGLFDQRLSKAIAASNRRAFDGISDRMLGNPARDALRNITIANPARDALKGFTASKATQEAMKQLTDQVSGSAMKALREQQKQSGGLSSILEGMNKLSNFAPQIEPQPFAMDDSLRRMGEIRAREKREAIEREMAMVNYLALLLKAFQRAEAREAAALERADRAEKREQAAITRGEQIQRRSLWIGGVALLFTVISAVAAVIALFAA